MTWQILVDPAFSSRLCLMLLHSLWQVAVLAIVVWGMDRLWPMRSVERLYVLHVAALLIALVAMPVTYALLERGAERSVASAAEAAAPVVEPILSGLPTLSIHAEPIGAKISTPSVSPTAAELPASVIAPTVWQQTVPWLVVGYGLGVVLMLVRLLRAMTSTNRLAARAKRIVDGALVETLQSLARRWSLKAVPLLAETQEMVVPKVVGLARPMILLPTAAIAGLSMDELEMILAHELTHVRRHDLWINLIQRLAEVVLFFNPALWRLSRRISTLREHCCDEMTCRAMSGTNAQPKLRYAAALLRVAELAKPAAVAHGDLAALAASGRSPSELRRRVARLFGEPLREPVRVSRTGWLAFAIVVLFTTCGPTIWPSKAQTTDGASETSNTANQFSFGGKVEVLAIGTHKENPQRWWDASGTPLQAAPFRLRGEMVSAEDDYLRRELVFRVQDLPKDAYLTYKFSSVKGWANAHVVLNGQESPPGYYANKLSVHKDNKTIGLRVGVAVGEWLTVTDGKDPVATHRADGKSVAFSGAFGFSGRLIKVGEAVIKDGETVTVISHNILDQQVRVIAFDKAGKMYRASMSLGHCIGTTIQSQWIFRELKPEQVDRFVLQVRDYEWVEIKGLPVNPNKSNEKSIPFEQ